MHADWFGMCIFHCSSSLLHIFEVVPALFYLCESLLACRLFVSAYPCLCFSHSFLDKSGAKFSKSGPGFSKYWVNSHPRMWWFILLKWIKLNSRTECKSMILCFVYLIKSWPETKLSSITNLCDHLGDLDHMTSCSPLCSLYLYHVWLSLLPHFSVFSHPGPHFVAVNNKNEIVVTDFHNHSVKVSDVEVILKNFHLVDNKRP